MCKFSSLSCAPLHIIKYLKEILFSLRGKIMKHLQAMKLLWVTLRYQWSKCWQRLVKEVQAILTWRFRLKIYLENWEPSNNLVKRILVILDQFGKCHYHKIRCFGEKVWNWVICHFGKFFLLHNCIRGRSPLGFVQMNLFMQRDQNSFQNIWKVKTNFSSLGGPTQRP